MNSYIFQRPFPRLASLQAFSDYRQAELANQSLAAVAHDGALLEYETLELRIHPPNVEIDNETWSDCTVVQIDSANRPGTLIEVVQLLTELGLNVKKARISSDGGWFVDEFHVTDNGRRVVSEAKLRAIKSVLSVQNDTDSSGQEASTVFELAGTDRLGLLCDVLDLLKNNGCEVKSAAVWTYNKRVAFVLSVTDRGVPIQDNIKLMRLQQLLAVMMDPEGNSIVTCAMVSGAIHYERRLHQLLLKEEQADWAKSNAAVEYEESIIKDSAETPCSLPSSCSWQEDVPNVGSRLSLSGTSILGSIQASVTSNLQSAASNSSRPPADVAFISPKCSKPVVNIKHYKQLNYWAVTIVCRDRKKLLFDTVCTLADLNYDVYHATIDSDGGLAYQLYYVRPRFGEFYWDVKRAAKLKYMLEGAIQRRFPKGLKVHIQAQALQQHDLTSLTKVWRDAGLWITRGQVRAHYEGSSSSGHTFYLMDASGGPPELFVVQKACQQVGGRMQSATDVKHHSNRSPVSNVVTHKFTFAFLQRGPVIGSSPSSLNSSV